MLERSDPVPVVDWDSEPDAEPDVDEESVDDATSDGVDVIGSTSDV